MVDEERVRQAEGAQLQGIAAEATRAWQQKFQGMLGAQQHASAVEEFATAWRASVDESLGCFSIAANIPAEQWGGTERPVVEALRATFWDEPTAGYAKPNEPAPTLADVVRQVRLSPRKLAASLRRIADALDELASTNEGAPDDAH